MQLKSIYFTIFVLIGGTMSLAPIHTSDVYDEDNYEMDEDSYNDAKNRFPRLSRSQMKMISRLMLGAFLAIYFTFAREKPSILKIEYDNVLMNYRVPNNVRQVKIDPNGKIAQFADKCVFFTTYDARKSGLFEKLGCKPEEALLVNATNTNIYYHWGGINGALSKQNDILLEEMKRKVPAATEEDRKYWGEMTDRKGNKWDSKRNPKIAREYAISKHPETKLNIAHILGPNFRNNEDKHFPFLKDTIKQMLEDNIGRYKVILLCTISTSLFARNDNDKRVALQAIVEAVEEVLAQYDKPEDLKTKIVCNYWDYHIENGIEGNLDRSGYFKKYRSEKLPT